MSFMRFKMEVNETFEFFYLLFLISGFIKSLLFLYQESFPDITLLSSMICIILLLRGFQVTYEFNVILVLLFLLDVIMLFSFVYTTSSVCCFWEKYLKSQTTILAFLFPLFFKNFSIVRFLNLWLLSTGIFSLYFIFFVLPYIYIDPLYYKIAGNYLFVSLVSGANFLLLLLNPFKSRSKLFSSNIFRILFSLINLVTLILSGGRGGIVAVIFIMIIFLLFKSLFIYYVKINLKSILANLLTLSFVIFIMLLISIKFKYNIEYLLSNAQERLSLFLSFLLGKYGGTSIDMREKYIAFSLFKINKNPLLGFGFASFGKEFHRSNIIDYPHNLFLEIWFELGIGGLFIVLLFFFFTYLPFVLKNKWRLLMINFYFLLNAMKSSGFHDLRILFGFLALSLLYVKYKFRGCET